MEDDEYRYRLEKLLDSYINRLTTIKNTIDVEISNGWFNLYCLADDIMTSTVRLGRKYRDSDDDVVDCASK